MPLVEYSLRLLQPLLRTLRTDLAPAKPKVLTLSNPDLVIHPAKLLEIFREELPPDSEPWKRLKARPDSDGIINWHKAHAITQQIIDTESFFSAVGCDFTATDVVTGRGGEFVHDLNYAWPKQFQLQFPEGFDLVIDIITNQCFNVAQAMANAWEAVKKGGYVMHIIPMNMVNQGFWNVSPTTYYDFYKANGGEIIAELFPVGVYEERARIDVQPVRRMRNVPDDTMNVLIVRRNETRFLRWPIMTKFVEHPEAKL